MKDIRNTTHTSSRSYDCLICEIEGKKVRFTYKVSNAQEQCIAEVFDGFKWNNILTMWDIGEIPNSSAYVWAEEKRAKRGEGLIKKMQAICKDIL